MSSSAGNDKDEKKPLGPSHNKSSEYAPRTNSAGKLEAPYKKSVHAEDAQTRLTDLNQERDQSFGSQTTKQFRYRLVLLISLSTLLCFLVGVTIYIHLKEFPPDELERPVRLAGELSRKHAVVMSDNLECSIYMKSLLMQNVDPRHIMLHGMMCLTITEPHSVAPDSAISSIWLYKQKKEHMIENILTKNLMTTRNKCIADRKKNKNCKLSGYMYIRGRYSSLKNWITKSKLHSQYVLNGKEMFRKFYQQFFKIFYGEQDNGPQSDYEIRKTHDYKSTAARKPSFLRKLRTSKLLETTLRTIPDINIFGTIWKKMFGFSDMRKVRENEYIVIRKGLAQLMLRFFFKSRTGQRKFGDNIHLYRLTLDPNIANFSISLVANDDRHSFGRYAREIVLSIYDFNQKKKLSETAFYAAILRAQKFFYHSRTKIYSQKGPVQLLANRKYWKKGETMFQYFAGKLDQEFNNDLNCTMTMKNPTRSTTLINWVNKEYSYLNVVNFALPSLFGSKIVHNGTLSLYPKFECGGYESRRAYMSSASVVITRNSVNKNFMQASTRGAGLYNVQPWIAVSASGSIRNVEAVSITALRIILFKESPAQAVNAPGAYYDIRDGKFYCDKERSEETKKLFSEMEKEFNLECLPVPQKDFMANDRVAMAAQQGHRQNDYIRSAVDGRAIDFNYPTGF